MNYIKVIIVMAFSLLLQACVIIPTKETNTETVIIWPELNGEEMLEYVYVDKFCEMKSLPSLLNIQPVNLEKYKKRGDTNGYINALKANNKKIADLLPKLRAEYKLCQQSLSL